MKRDLRLAAAGRGIWTAGELQKMPAGRGMVISAGKMPGRWPGRPNAVTLAGLDVICAVPGGEPGELLIPEPVPAARLALALAAVHAARPEAIRTLALGDVDLGNRRITLAGQSRPLDDLTRRLILTWLDCRRARWPHTASPCLLINNQTAMSTRPVSENWLTTAFRGPAATLGRPRAGRQLDQALTCGPGPLHLAAASGLDDTTAIRYATAARQLLDTAAEHDTPG